jgi:RNA polymerase sigma factor (sigma-70 family)
MTPAFALKRKPDAAFESLYRRHVHEVYRYALAMLGNPSDAEDVTQTTFLNAYRAIQSGERPRKPAAWLRTIAHNVCRQRFRQAERRPREVVALDELRGPEVHDEPEGPSAADIKRALGSLPFNQRSAIVMRELEGRRQSEIAAALGLSESAVEALLFRARRAMREQLEASITCGEAERAVSRQLDRSLPAAERRRLRAHLRECEECATFARQARAQRGALKSLGAAPLPASLLSWGGGSSVVGAGAAIGLKVAAGVAAVAVAVGAGDLGIRYLDASVQARHGRATDGAGAGSAATGAARAGGAQAGQAAAPGDARRGGSAAARARPGRPSPNGRGRTHGGGAHGAPGSAGSPAVARGNGVRAHGTPAGGRGNGVRAHGSPSAGSGSSAHGTPTRAHGTPTRSHSTPHGTPTRSHGSPATGQAGGARGRGPGAQTANPRGHTGQRHTAPPPSPRKPPKG